MRPRTNLPVAISAYKVRRLIRQYLAGTSVPDRERMYSYIKQEAGGEMAMVADLLSHMKPPAQPARARRRQAGLLRDRGAGLGQGAAGHLLRPTSARVRPLSPLSDDRRPARRSRQRRAADRLVGGRLDKGSMRTGQAARYGYIVIAPAWTEEHQKRYGYSAREHAAVLNSLRDACRRFSIDTDRVYLSGQSIGGDAAWDIGLAHPDLWAGVIPIVAQSDRYCTFYWENARYVPFYVVAGELDGGKMVNNAHSTLDRWLRYGFNATVVEYRGRGHEDFYDEILRMFDWMSRFRRNFFPREFACETMRSWDNFFWWVEVEGLPPRSRSIRPTGRRPPARSRRR